VKKAIKWAFILLSIVAVSFFVLNMAGFFVESKLAAHSYQSGPQFHHHHHGERFSHFAGPRSGMMQSQIPLFGLFLPFVLKMALVLIGGLMLWLSKGKKVNQLISVVLLSLGVFFLLPKILGIPFVIVAGYLIYKMSANDSPTFENITIDDIVTTDQFAVSPYYTNDYLDEWEKAVRREEK
jgi:hypothetical protein